MMSVTASGAGIDLKRIKAAIRAQLKADGCTQKDLAWYLDISEKHVSQVLTGKAEGSPGLIKAMASAVGLTVTVAVRHDP
jgi:transcriptional regulator with XRE-family HTH domain